MKFQVKIDGTAPAERKKNISRGPLPSDRPRRPNKPCNLHKA